MARKPDISLFGDPFVVDPPRKRKVQGVALSAAVHGIIIALLILIPLLWTESLPDPKTPSSISVLLYNPPPPPPAPRSAGSRQVVATPTPEPTPESVPRETLTIEEMPTEPPSEGDDDGSAEGVPEGMEEGVVGGEVGGVPGGQLGGVVGGTGDVVLDYDRPPKIIRRTQPDYPHTAFTQRIEGTVLIEIIIGIDGRVRDAWILKSVPGLDAAALRCVWQWLFSPALKDGHPVPTRATAPVTFRIL